MCSAVQAVVINKKINCGRGYELVIPVRFHFHGYEKTVNWLMKKTEVIDIKLQRRKCE